MLRTAGGFSELIDGNVETARFEGVAVQVAGS